MTWTRALAYFLREAGANLARGWRVSLLAVATIAVSLYVGGAFLQAGGNLARLVDEWRRQARLVVYLQPETPAAAAGELRRSIAAQSWVGGVEEVDAAAAARRFRATFPSLAELLEGWEGEPPLPASLEVELEEAADPAAFAAWLTELARHPAVALIDDDRDWLAGLAVAIAVLRGVGLALGAVLLGAAIFTIASVVRLTAYLHAEEISILRLVGGTEFFIRGPFYAEGFLQGLAGGAFAAGALAATQAVLRTRGGESLLAWALAGGATSPALLAGLPVLGALAGLLGAAASLRRESLGATAEA